ncbi:DUF3052 family protein [Neoactinobaculum massilliense]|uniref:DUF3052 family protein n=1 Tax=Neoactinobaculum massilliense TaxID=2364794 RepID=UPI000F5277DE|nr:DUF3052 family protein [Neoactinobaculum massilliense]
MTSYGFEAGNVIQEFGYDDDVAGEIREDIEKATGESLVDEDYQGIVDGALAWWRADDGDADDLADLLIDMKANFDSEHAVAWLLVPAPRQPGYVPHTVIEEAATTAGMQATTSQAISDDWTGVRLAAMGLRA